MNPSWLETVGTASLYCYFVLVGASLIALLVRAATRTPSPESFASQARISGDSVETAPRSPTFRERVAGVMLEYVGNTGRDDHAHAAPSGLPDRRRNVQARFLMDYINEEMIGLDVTSTEREQLLEGLREAMRSEGQGQPG